MGLYLSVLRYLLTDETSFMSSYVTADFTVPSIWFDMTIHKYNTKCSISCLCRRSFSDFPYHIKLRKKNHKYIALLRYKKISRSTQPGANMVDKGSSA